MKTKKKITQVEKINTIEQIVQVTNLSNDDMDGGRLFFDEDRIDVDASNMTRKEYDAYEKLLRKTIKGKGYEVFAWNDSSGYSCWKSQSKCGDFNYVQVQVNITDPDKALKNVKQLKNDVRTHFGRFVHLDKYREWK